jgi:hypothetical protein
MMDPTAPNWLSEPYVTLLLALVFLLPALLIPRPSERIFLHIESLAARLATRRIFVVIFLFLLIIALRVALLDQLLLPNPGIHDEFSYLLMADTFAHGRLANPPHPLWKSFETFHVFFHPTYASKYPVAQGIVLAIGQLLGHPWIGVLLSAAAMAAAFVWMLQAWIPARWALLAGILAAAKLCVASYWINSYWGGAVAAIGGALVLGAFGRAKRRVSLSSGILLGLGIAILLNSRPYESSFFCLPIGLALLLWFARCRPGLERRAFAKLVLAPAAGILLVTFAAMAFYNWRVTGNPAEPPLAYDLRLHNHAAVFLWQNPKPPIHYDIAELDYFYNDSDNNSYSRSWPAFVSVFQEKLWRCSTVFLWPACVFLVPCVFFLYRDARVRLILLALLATVFGYSLVVWPGPHYLAPAAGAWFALLVQCIRHLRTVRLLGRPIGAALSRVVFLALIFDVSQLVVRKISDPQGWGGWGIIDRAQLRDQLEATPGKHVVLVRYGQGHSVHEEWVYNSAQIDASKVVWARDLPGERNARLLNYYCDRTIWLAEPDADSVSLLRRPCPRP